MLLAIFFSQLVLHIYFNIYMSFYSYISVHFDRYLHFYSPPFMAWKLAAQHEQITSKMKWQQSKICIMNITSWRYSSYSEEKLRKSDQMDLWHWLNPFKVQMSKKTQLNPHTQWWPGSNIPYCLPNEVPTVVQTAA